MISAGPIALGPAFLGVVGSGGAHGCDGGRSAGQKIGVVRLDVSASIITLARFWADRRGEGPAR
jgi:hypothetical protein